MRNSWFFEKERALHGTIAAAKKYKCSGCPECHRRFLRSVAVGRLHELGCFFFVDQFEREDPPHNLYVSDTIMEQMQAVVRQPTVTTHRLLDTDHNLGNVSGETML